MFFNNNQNEYTGGWRRKRFELSFKNIDSNEIINTESRGIIFLDHASMEEEVKETKF